MGNPLSDEVARFFMQDETPAATPVQPVPTIESVPTLAQEARPQVTQFTPTPLLQTIAQNVGGVQPVLSERNAAKITSYVRSLAQLKRESVKLVVRKRPLDGFGQWTMRDSAVVSVTDFSLEEMMLIMARKFGSGRYQFVITVPPDPDSGQGEYTFTWEEAIDLDRDNIRQEQSQEKPAVAPTQDPMVQVMMTSMSELRTTVAELARSMAEADRARQEKLMELLINKVTQQATPVTNPVDPAKMMSEVGNVFKQAFSAAAQQNQGQPPSQDLMATAKSMTDMFTLGIQAATIAKGGGDGEKEEGGIDWKGLLNGVAGKFAEGLGSKLGGGGIIPQINPAQQALPGAEPADPSIMYVASVLNGCAIKFSQGSSSQEIAGLLRTNLTPHQIAILTQQPVASLVQSIPALQPYAAQFATVLSLLMRRPMSQRVKKEVPADLPVISVEGTPEITPPAQEKVENAEPQVEQEPEDASREVTAPPAVNNELQRVLDKYK